MNKSKIILSIIIVAITILMGIGTYAFFTADIQGNIENNNIVQKTGSLSIEYIEGQNIVGEGIEPGWNGTKTFTIKNTGTLPVSYDIVFADVMNTFINDEVIYSGTCKSSQTSCKNINQGIVAEEEFFISQNINIEPNEEHSYEIKIEFIETGENQDYNNHAELSGKISIYETGTYVIKGLKVDIVDNMIPVSWDGSTLVKADITNTKQNWFDYDNQKWANAVLVTDESRENYETANQGTSIIEDDVLAYYTYVPRYRYLLWNASNNEECLNDYCDEQEIMIEFENKNEEKSTGSTNGEWLTHPAFTFGKNELNGIWVGKFTTSVDSNTTCYTSPSEANCNSKTLNPRIKPNLDMWKYVDVSTAYSVSQKLQTNSMYGLNSYDNADSHMMKNMEWGAVTYLSHSKYGKYGNENYIGNNKEIYINNYLQDFKTETGCSGGTTHSSQNESGCPHSYPEQTLEATGASTTGNIYGIYDMSGGVWEYVMGQIVQSVGTPLGIFHANSSSGTWDTIPQQKYYDSYTYDTNVLSHGRGQLGDATKEALKDFEKGEYDGWYGDRSAIPSTEDYPWFIRGGSANQSYNSGAFSFIRETGYTYSNCGFRLVLILE